MRGIHIDRRVDIALQPKLALHRLKYTFRHMFKSISYNGMTAKTKPKENLYYRDHSTEGCPRLSICLFCTSYREGN